MSGLPVLNIFYTEQLAPVTHVIIIVITDLLVVRCWRTAAGAWRCRPVYARHCIVHAICSAMSSWVDADVKKG